jgi:hypothetical protein
MPTFHLVEVYLASVTYFPPTVLERRWKVETIHVYSVARSRVVDPELFVSDPTPDLTFKEDSARSGSGSCFRSGNAGLRLNRVSYMSVNVFVTWVF